MSKIIVSSSNRWRPFIYGGNVPPQILADQFDWLDDQSELFLNWRGFWYHLSQFERVAPGDPRAKVGWDGALAESAWSGMVVKVSPDGEKYKLGSWHQQG